MTELMPLFLRTGNKEALFAVFWATLGREPGKLADVDFASLRDLAERSGVKLTESQVRKRVDELKKLGILDVAPRRERGRFDLYVYRPAPFAAEAEKPEPATPLFDAAFGKGVESFVGDGTAPDPRYRANSASAPVGRLNGVFRGLTQASPFKQLRLKLLTRKRLRSLPRSGRFRLIPIRSGRRRNRFRNLFTTSTRPWQNRRRANVSSGAAPS